MYSLNPKVIKENKLLYVCLSGNMVAAIAYQIYVNYLFNIIEGTLQIKDYIIPVAIIGLAAAVGSVLVSTAMDKVGKSTFSIPPLLPGSSVVWLFGVLSFS